MSSHHHEITTANIHQQQHCHVWLVATGWAQAGHIRGLAGQWPWLAAMCHGDLLCTGGPESTFQSLVRIIPPCGATPQAGNKEADHFAKAAVTTNQGKWVGVCNRNRPSYVVMVATARNIFKAMEIIRYQSSRCTNGYQYSSPEGFSYIDTPGQALQHRIGFIATIDTDILGWTEDGKCMSGSLQPSDSITSLSTSARLCLQRLFSQISVNGHRPAQGTLR